MNFDKIDVENLKLTLHGKVAFVTGASSGLGNHFAKVLAAAGAQVAIAARREQKLEALVNEIEAAGGTALSLPLDVTDAHSVTSALEEAESALGLPTVLVNNAGVAAAEVFEKGTEESWDYVMDTNLKGAWRVAHAFANRLIDTGTPGSIVNIASVLGLGVGHGLSTYAISKAGVVQMTKHMATELAGKGIRTNALCPGYFKTEMNGDFFDTKEGQDYIKTTPARRTGILDELSAPLLLLASDAGSFINGVALPVDGGHLVKSL